MLQLLFERINLPATVARLAGNFNTINVHKMFYYACTTLNAFKRLASRIRIEPHPQSLLVKSSVDMITIVEECIVPGVDAGDRAGPQIM